LFAEAGHIFQQSEGHPGGNILSGGKGKFQASQLKLVELHFAVT